MDTIEKYVNDNIASIKSVEFFSSCVIINFFDGTCVDIMATDDSLELTKY